MFLHLRRQINIRTGKIVVYLDGKPSGEHIFFQWQGKLFKVFYDCPDSYMNVVERKRKVRRGGGG